MKLTVLLQSHSWFCNFTGGGGLKDVKTEGGWGLKVGGVLWRWELREVGIELGMD